MEKKKVKGRMWDGKSRVVTDLSRKRFDEIFGKKEEEEMDPEDAEYLEELKKKL